MRAALRRLLVLTFGATLYLAGAAHAVEVAVITSGAPASWRAAVNALRRAGRAHSFTEVELAPDRARARQAVAALRGRAALLVAFGPVAAQAAREGLPDLPLVYCMVQDPAGIGLLPAPAPHVSGVAFEVPVRNQLAAFRMVNPRAVRIGILYSPQNTARQAEEAQNAAPVLRLAVTVRPVESEKAVPMALRALVSGPDAVDALWLPPDALLLSAETRRYLFAETLRAGKAIYSFSSALIAEGALASNGPDHVSIGEEAAALVDRLAAGERTIEIRAPKAELVVNVRMADRLNVSIPEATLKAARKQ